MKHKLALLALSGWMMMTVFQVSAQDTKVFSGEIQTFADELMVFMQRNISPESEAILNSFLMAWRGDSLMLFNEPEKEKIVKTSLDLVRRNARPYPHFTHYLSTLLALKNYRHGTQQFINWDKGLDMIIGNRKVSLQTMDRYLAFVKLLADSSTLYRSSSVEWRFSAPDFRFAVDSAIRVVFSNTNLICYVRNDSIQILNTKGSYKPLSTEWQGQGGLVTWERAGFEPGDVYAQLTDYDINMSRSEYTAKDVVFVNKHHFDEPLKGILTDKVKMNKTPADADYPQFVSYQKDFSIKALYKDIDFEGGLSMQGAKLVGTGNREKQAKIFIYRKDTLVLVASSNYFAFKSDRINSSSAGILINLKNDSIFHHGMALSFMVPNRELTLSQTENFTSQSPYFNSYHNIDMSFEQLVWKMDEPVMRFTAMMGSTIGNANFESVNFYNHQEYLGLQLMDESHPLVSIRSFARMMGTEEFLAEDYAAYLKKSITQVKQMLMRMAALGFIFYDSENGMATIRPRLHDYIAASIARVDYDVISIPSRVNAPVENAVFDLRTYDLTINGIPRIFVSDSQNVVIYPDHDRIILKKNRHFQFDGQVQAGLFTFSGKNFFFNYDTFKIDMQKIDSLRIRYLTGMFDNYGFPVTETTENVFENMKGEVYIDRPDNKSGRVSYAEYPIFRSTHSGYVYYDDKTIHDGVYDRERFFFQINPFEMDSLDNFNRVSMKFDGSFTSAGIFPVFEETLRLQPDKSMGFRYITPAGGFELYGGKGNFVNEIALSNKGLEGSGTVNYLTSSSVAEHIQFFPDSLIASAEEFTIARSTSGTQYPQVSSVNNNIRWLPYQDELYAYKTESSFNMFNPSTHLDGSLVLRPAGLSGNGRMTLEGAEISSTLFAYKADIIDADTADFYLKSLHSEGFTVLTENINSHIDFSTQTGSFRSNEDYTLVSFPENKYVSFLNQFDWDMNKKILAMGSSSQEPPATEVAEEGFSGPRYISIDPDQDSLSFIAPMAYYDYDSNLIKAHEVRFIDIADARIYPEDEKLTVQPDARLRTLYKASIVANRTTRYYELFDATVNISARNKYLGSAYYNYKDETEQLQEIYFNNLTVDNNLQTIGTGTITEEEDFTLSPNYRYQGKVHLEANNPLLVFDGSTLIEHNCENLPTRWMNFRAEIDPMNIMIPIGEDLIDINRNKIFNGLFMYYDSVHVYPTFLSGRKFSSDRPVVSSTGFLHYSHPKQEYQIAAREKLLDLTLPGNLVTLHRENCQLYGEGKIDPGAKLGQIKLTAVGNLLHKSIENQTEMEIMLGIDFYIADDILNVMAAEIDSMPSLPATDLNSPLYTKGVVELIGKTRYDAMKSELSLFGTLKETPAELKHTILFNELKLRWDDEANSWVSVGKIGIASINNTQINKRVDGMLELQIKRSGDILDFYFQVDRRTWYYFGYTRGVMQVHSSNNTFLEMMKKLKPNERRQKVTSGETYIYMVSTDVKKNTFLRRYREVQEQQAAPGVEQ